MKSNEDIKSNEVCVIAKTTCCVAPPLHNDDVIPLHRLVSAAWRRFDKPVVAIILLVLALAFALPAQLELSLVFTWEALLHIAPWIAVSGALAAYAQASDADRLIAIAFRGHPWRMVTLAAVLGVVSPFCSCGVVPLIAGMLMAGVPLAPIMVFWISSPLMDPTMFVMTAAAMGMEFAIVKTIAAMAMGLFAGGVTHCLLKHRLVTTVLRHAPAKSCCSSALNRRPVVQWKIWQTADSRKVFVDSVRSNAWFLGRWMIIAFLLESLMIAYLPGEKVTAWLGQGVGAIPLAVAIGIPSYLNGFAALPLVTGLVSLGMSPAVALAFLVAGGVTSLPAMAAVWGLVKPRVFALYLGLALTGALGVAYGYAAWLKFFGTF